ncbi:MAG: FAD-dependent oxidoreductase [Dehalococcoidales bacterium]|nr:FAD-dependent oxidoreductase [Dehalococcoidales bacterium]
MNDSIMKTDVAIIGSGVTGLAAALTTAEGGLRATVFEKQRSLGGTSNFFHGTFAVESRMQRERYITYSRDQAWRNIMEYSHWRANPRLVRAVVDESAATIDWLQKQGVEFTDATINMPDMPRTYHVIKGYGESIVRALALKAREKKVEIKAATPVKRILKQGEKTGGVVVEENGEEIRIEAGAVMIASGGYANNKEWIRKYTRFDLGVNISPVGNMDKMGDGIRMARESGAAEEGISVLHMLRIGPVHPAFESAGSLELPALQPDLWVDPRGERFCDEGMAFFDTSLGNINARFREGYTFSIFDDSIIQRLRERGMVRSIDPYNPPGTWPQDFDQKLAAALEKDTGEVFSAGSIGELALKINVSPQVLQATVDEYNGFCRKGHDDLFAKDPRYLWPLTGQTFYAMKAHTAFLGTLGGIRINYKMEVMDKNDRAIPGLYAGGNDAGGMWGDSYCMDLSSGASSAFAINSGRIAGRNILQYLGSV